MSMTSLAAQLDMWRDTGTRGSSEPPPRVYSGESKLASWAIQNLYLLPPVDKERRIHSCEIRYGFHDRDDLTLDHFSRPSSI
jgi:hypothetical protein